LTADGETEDPELEPEVPIHNDVDEEFPEGVAEAHPKHGEMKIWNLKHQSSIKN
jgi:hypothetical protein